MSVINDGGPNERYHLTGDEQRALHSALRKSCILLESKDGDGMSLRDWFAGQALAGMTTWTPVGPSEICDLRTSETLQRRAEWAYAQADAMLRARAAATGESDHG